MEGARREGFTLIELMIVVAIIGVLAAIAIPKFAEMVRKSNEGSTKGNLGSLRSALSIYYSDMEGNFPNDDLASLLVNGKYLTAIPTAKAPGYHAESSRVCDGMYIAAGGCRMGVGSPPQYDGTLGPLWVYWEMDTPPTSGTPRNHGDLWVGCTHTDTKRAVWTSY